MTNRATTIGLLLRVFVNTWPVAEAPAQHRWVRRAVWSMAGNTGHHIRTTVDQTKTRIPGTDVGTGDGHQRIILRHRGKFTGIRDSNIHRMSNPSGTSSRSAVKKSMATDTLLTDHAAFKITGIGSATALVDIVTICCRILFPVGIFNPDNPFSRWLVRQITLHH